jgi:Secretion system C-terminal sorting domain
MKNKLYTSLLLTLIMGIEQIQAQFYNQGAEVTVQSGATVTIEGDFFNKVGSNFKNYGTLEIKNYVTNDQLMTDDFGGYWIFNGTSGVKIGGAETIWMNSLNINNPGGFVLQTSLRISKQMEFNNGIMTAESPGNIVFFTPSGQIGSPAPTDASHINGEVVKEGDSQIFKYPVGDGTRYQPIEVDFATNENGLLSKYNPTDAGSAGFGTSGSEATPLNSYNSKEHWDLTPINGGTTKAKVKIFWDSYNDGFAEAAGLRRVAHLSPLTNKWENEGTNAGMGSPATGYVLSNTIADWSPFTLGTVASVALPIRLVNFTGKKVGETNVLNWQTTSEIDASHFEIERSVGNNVFVNIGKINSKGKSIIEKNNYQFIDFQPINDINYYRLKLVDLNGKYEYSKIIGLNFENKNETIGEFYPNPTTENYSNIAINAEQRGEWLITKMDISGKVLKTEKRILEKGQNTITVFGIEKGMNIVQFENENNRITRKLIR